MDEQKASSSRDSSKGICAKPPRRIAILQFLVVFTLLLFAAVMFLSTFTICYAVELDGEVIGSVTSANELESVLSNIDEKVSEMLGYDYELNNRVSYSVDWESRSELVSSNLIETAIFENIDEVEKQFVITVDGAAIGSISDLEVFQSAMGEVLGEYNNENTVSTEFLSDILYEYTYASSQQALDREMIVSILRGLPIRTVDKITYAEAVAYDTEYLDDDTLYVGESEIAQTGADGETQVSATVTYLNGEEISREITAQSVLSEPVAEIIKQGTAEKPVTASTGLYTWPTNGSVSSYFGPRNISIGSSDHKGLDIAAPSGESIYAADGGQVIFADWSGGYGYLVQVQHDNGDVTYYGHCSSIDVSVGELVYQGQPIAEVGMTGTATGNHLHFEIRVDGTAINPLNCLEEASA